MWTGIGLAAVAVGALGLLVYWARQGRNRAVGEDAAEFTETPAAVDVPVSPSRLPSWFEPIRAMLGLLGVLAEHRCWRRRRPQSGPASASPYRHRHRHRHRNRTAAPGRPGPAFLAVMILTSVLAWALLRRGLNLTRRGGAVLLAVYILTLPLVLAI